MRNRGLEGTLGMRAASLPFRSSTVLAGLVVVLLDGVPRTGKSALLPMTAHE
jgi:hypothetical protein